MFFLSAKIVVVSEETDFADIAVVSKESHLVVAEESATFLSAIDCGSLCDRARQPRFVSRTRLSLPRIGSEKPTGHLSQGKFTLDSSSFIAGHLSQGIYRFGQLIH